MKKKPKKKPAYDNLTMKSIVKLVRDLEAGKSTGTVRQWRAVAMYYQTRHAMAAREMEDVQAMIAPLVLGREIYSLAMSEIAGWLNRRVPVPSEHADKIRAAAGFSSVLRKKK